MAMIVHTSSLAAGAAMAAVASYRRAMKELKLKSQGDAAPHLSDGDEEAAPKRRARGKGKEKGTDAAPRTAGDAAR